MKRRIWKLVAGVLGAVWLGVSCSEREELGLQEPGQVTFQLSFGSVSATDSTGAGTLTRAGRTEEEQVRIGRMWYVITDSRGERIALHTHKLSPDFSRLTVDGLKAGDYTIAFLAAAEPEPGRATVSDPERLAETWLANPEAEAPLDEQFFYRRVELSIGREQAPMAQTVLMERCVGRVDVDLNLSSEYMERFIRRVEVEFDDPSEAVSTTLDAAGRYGGAGGIGTYDVTRNRSFYSLPSLGALSGTVTVDSERSDGTSFVRRYRFSGCRIEAGRVARIRIDYRHPESREGLLYVRESDFGRFGTDTMFLADEPRGVFYSASRRSFYPNAPLQVSVAEDHRLRMRFYSPVEIRDVKILCRFNKFSPEFVELAHFDRIYPFMEASFPLPVVSSERTFTTAGGRKIVVPAQPGLTNEEVSLVIQTDDPFMEKVRRIDSRWYIRFSAYSADNGHAYWRHMNPLLCRHGVALALNMAFMFSSEEFNEEMNKYEGRLLDNGRNPIDLDGLRQRIRSHGGLVLGCVAGVGRLGGGQTYGLANYCYTGVYFDATPPGSHPHNYARQAMFHEYGHCLGYSHSSTMTYGDQWTVLCATVFVRMGSEGKLPVCSKDEVGNLPM